MHRSWSRFVTRAFKSLLSHCQSLGNRMLIALLLFCANLISSVKVRSLLGKGNANDPRSEVEQLRVINARIGVNRFIDDVVARTEWEHEQAIDIESYGAVDDESSSSETSERPSERTPIDACKFMDKYPVCTFLAVAYVSVLFMAFLWIFAYFWIWIVSLNP